MNNHSNINRTEDYWNQFAIEYLVWDEKKDSRNSHEKKISTHKISTKKLFDLENTYEKKFWDHEIPTKKSLASTKRTWGKI